MPAIENKEAILGRSILNMNNNFLFIRQRFNEL